MTQEAKNTRNLLLGLLVCGVLLIGIVAVLNVRQSLQTATPTPTFAPDLPNVTPIDPPQELADFTLPSGSGDPLSLSSLRGKYTLLFFGYTHCPDYCPLTLAQWKQIKSGLGSDAERINFLFISVDGARDTPEVLSRYLSRFDPVFLGMSGDDVTLTQIGTEYGLYYQLNTDEGADYSVDHSTAEYLIDPAGAHD